MLKFVLKKLDTGADIELPEQKEYVVGRKDCDIAIVGDSSVSRKHAILKVSENSVSIVDCGAKYRTFVNEQKLEINEEMTLKLQDKVKFGILNSEYMLQIDFSKFKYVTATSGLSNNKKEVLKKILENCGGIVVDTWYQQCTHLTIEKVLLTEKVLEALIDGKPFVIPAYWTALEKSIKNPKANQPDINEYNKPPVAEMVNIESDLFLFKEQRKTLFKDKIFVFATKQGKNRLKSLIGRCGGECQAWDEKPLILYEVQKSSKTYIIISSDKSQVPGFSEFIQEYQKQNKRTIPLNEIAMAVVKCSTEQDCNPEFDKAKHVFGNRLVSQIETNTKEPSKMVPQTETVSDEYFDAQSKQSKDDNVILATTIPPTFEAKLGESEDLNQPSTSGMRKNDDVIMIDDDDAGLNDLQKQKKEHPRTKIKTEENYVVDAETQKIQRVEIVEIINVNNKKEPAVTGKRFNEDPGNQSSKKIRLDAGIPESRKDVVSKSPESQKPKENVSNKSICKTQDFIKISSKKRKAIELAAAAEVEPEGASPKLHIKKEVDSRVNPFAQMSSSFKTKAPIASNPFEQLKKRVKSDEPIKVENPTENPFKMGKISEICSKLHCVTKNQNFGKNSCFDFPEKENSQVIKPKAPIKREICAQNNNSTFMDGDTTKRSVFGTSWISKNCSIHVEKVKQEDPRLKEIIEMFKDCIKVKPLTIPQREKIVNRSVNNTTLDVTDGKPNFKRFRKIPPVHPQVEIITKKDLIKVGSKKATDKNYDTDEDDIEKESQKKSKSKKIAAL